MAVRMAVADAPGTRTGRGSPLLRQGTLSTNTI